MNFNSNNGTIIYSLNLSSLISSNKPDIIKISKYFEMINKHGINNICGAKKFMKFIEKFPDIYINALRNENIEENTEIENEEMEDTI